MIKTILAFPYSFVAAWVVFLLSCKTLPPPLPVYDIAIMPDQSGWYNFTNGKYAGQLSRGIPNGIGKYVYKNGIHYEGNFVNGEIQGVGVLNIPNYGIVKGYFESGLVSRGEIEYENGNFYTGTFRNGKKYEGVFVRENFAYSGRFEHDLPSGKGLYVDYQKGIAYQGDFIAGQKDGEFMEYSLKNEKAEYKIYKNGSDVTFNLYNDLATKELEIEYAKEQELAEEQVDRAKSEIGAQKKKVDSARVKLSTFDIDFGIIIAEKCKCSFLNFDKYYQNKSNPTLNSVYEVFYTNYLIASKPELSKNQIEIEISRHSENALQDCFFDEYCKKKELESNTKIAEPIKILNVQESPYTDFYGHVRPLTDWSGREVQRRIIYSNGDTEDIYPDYSEYLKIIYYSEGPIESKRILKNGKEFNYERGTYLTVSIPCKYSVTLSEMPLEFIRDIETKYKGDLLDFCLSAITDTATAKQNVLDQINDAIAKAEQELQIIEDNYRKKIKDQAEIKSRQEREKPTVVKDKITAISAQYNNKATNEFKAFKSKLVNSPNGCACGCIILSPTRPSQSGMRGCPR